MNPISMRAQPVIGSTMRREQESVAGWAARGTAAMDEYGVTVFRIGRLRLDEEASRELALELVTAVHERLVQGGFPRSSSVEHDRVQNSNLPPGQTSRTLLPHHDGGHTSYLTPSRYHDPQWHPSHRTFATDSFTTTAAHKAYQGVFVPEPGDALSVTTYYPLIAILSDAFSFQQGRRPPDVSTLSRWLGDALRGAVQRSGDHRCPYPALSAFLGLTWPDMETVGLHYADSEVDAFGAVPDGVRTRAQNCPCRSCDGDTTRLICNTTKAALGLSWPQFRHRYERWACTERFDLVLGHNLTMLHGGLCGSGCRTIEPLCVIADSNGDTYEQWLARSWEAAFAAA